MSTTAVSRARVLQTAAASVACTLIAMLVGAQRRDYKINYFGALMLLFSYWFYWQC